ncbi:hypothetical protein LCGC14_2535850 [marine sediment metagenome]|uniref:Uncharacterized protein n=1 Tax=marine sediment metagenome TaxID=412755 RepID=A0A0F9AS68_9ZZZZ
MNTTTDLTRARTNRANCQRCHGHINAGELYLTIRSRFEETMRLCHSCATQEGYN